MYSYRIKLRACSENIHSDRDAEHDTENIRNNGQKIKLKYTFQNINKPIIIRKEGNDNHGWNKCYCNTEKNFEENFKAFLRFALRQRGKNIGK